MPVVKLFSRTSPETGRHDRIVSLGLIHILTSSRHCRGDADWLNQVNFSVDQITAKNTHTCEARLARKTLSGRPATG